MTKARFTRSVGNRREWLSNEDIVTLALWHDRQSAQWHCDDCRSLPRMTRLLPKPLLAGHLFVLQPSQ
jgi:hypothetical protein